MDEVVARFREAYLMMVREADYRPAAPGDGCGNISLTDEQMADPERLDREATAYAHRFHKEEDDALFTLGRTHFPNNRAFVWTVEAARLLCSGYSGTPFAHKLLTMAVAEIETVMAEERSWDRPPPLPAKYSPQAIARWQKERARRTKSTRS